MVSKRFPDHHACVNQLEAGRWGEEPHWPVCASAQVVRKTEKHRGGRWNCQACKASCNVRSGTLFDKTKSLSRYQLGYCRESAVRLVQAAPDADGPDAG